MEELTNEDYEKIFPPKEIEKPEKNCGLFHIIENENVQEFSWLSSMLRQSLNG
mgnify:CR=1 FL=1